MQDKTTVVFILNDLNNIETFNAWHRLLTDSEKKVLTLDVEQNSTFHLYEFDGKLELEQILSNIKQIVDERTFKTVDNYLNLFN